jgi:hypothetical protein
MWAKRNRSTVRKKLNGIVFPLIVAMLDFFKASESDTLK